jgi:hypothetical protein
VWEHASAAHALALRISSHPALSGPYAGSSVSRIWSASPSRWPGYRRHLPALRPSMGTLSAWSPRGRPFLQFSASARFRPTRRCNARSRPRLPSKSRGRRPPKWLMFHGVRAGPVVPSVVIEDRPSRRALIEAVLGSKTSTISHTCPAPVVAGYTHVTGRLGALIGFTACLCIFHTHHNSCQAPAQASLGPGHGCLQSEGRCIDALL